MWIVGDLLGLLVQLDFENGPRRLFSQDIRMAARPL